MLMAIVCVIIINISINTSAATSVTRAPFEATIHVYQSMRLLIIIVSSP